MGMAASQARYLALTARKSNVEYEGQQINQARTSLANQTANYFNQMLAMSVPTPPDKTNFTTVQYSFTDGINTEVLSNYYQLGNANSDYNYVVTTYHNEKVFTGQRKRMSDPQVQYTTTDKWTYDPASTDNVRPKIVDKAFKNDADNSYTIQTSDGVTHVFRQVQPDDRDEPQVRAINLGMIVAGVMGPDTSARADLSIRKTLNFDTTNLGHMNIAKSFGAIAAADTAKIAQIKEIFGIAEDDDTFDINDYMYSATANNGGPAYAKKADVQTAIANPGALTAYGLTDRYKFSKVDPKDEDTVNALAKLYKLSVADIDKVKSGELVYYTDGNFRFVTSADYEGTPAVPAGPNVDKTTNYTWDNTASHFLDDATGEIIHWPGAGDPESFKISYNGLTEVEFTWDGTQYLDGGGNVFSVSNYPGTPANPTLSITVSEPGTPAEPAHGPNADAVITQGAGTNGAYYTDGRGNFSTYAELEDAVATYNHNVEKNDHEPINIDIMTPTNKPVFSNYTAVGNCRLEELFTEDVNDPDTKAEIDQIIKDMKSADGSPLSARNLMACFDTDPNTGELIYKGGLYSFTMGGHKYYTTRNDLDASAGTSIVDNDIDVQQNKLAYYNAVYVNTRVEDTQKALLETDGQGRFKTLKLEDDSVTYTLNAEQVTDDDAYNDAMNRYYYEKSEYEKQIADINAKTEIIQAQDRTLELRMMQLGTEQSALQNEMEAVKKVVDKHVELGFKTFGG